MVCQEDVVRFLRTIAARGGWFECRWLPVAGGRVESQMWSEEDWPILLAPLRERATTHQAYVTFNPAREGVERVTDADVVSRQWLFLDIDPERPAGTSASDAQVEGARTLADEVCTWVMRTWVGQVPQVMCVESGNGFHLYFAVELGREEDVAPWYAAVADAFKGDARGKIDLSVKNLSRIAKVPGLAEVKKGSGRVARLVSYPDDVVGVSAVETLRAVAPVQATPRQVELRGDRAELLSAEVWLDACLDDLVGSQACREHATWLSVGRAIAALVGASAGFDVWAGWSQQGAGAWDAKQAAYAASAWRRWCERGADADREREVLLGLWKRHGRGFKAWRETTGARVWVEHVRKLPPCEEVVASRREWDDSELAGSLFWVEACARALTGREDGGVVGGALRAIVGEDDAVLHMGGRWEGARQLVQGAVEVSAKAARITLFGLWRRADGGGYRAWVMSDEGAAALEQWREEAGPRQERERGELFRLLGAGEEARRAEGGALAEHASRVYQRAYAAGGMMGVVMARVPAALRGAAGPIQAAALERALTFCGQAPYTLSQALWVWDEGVGLWVQLATPDEAGLSVVRAVMASWHYKALYRCKVKGDEEPRMAYLTEVETAWVKDPIANFLAITGVRDFEGGSVRARDAQRVRGLHLEDVSLFWEGGKVVVRERRAEDWARAAHAFRWADKGQGAPMFNAFLRGLFEGEDCEEVVRLVKRWIAVAVLGVACEGGAQTPMVCVIGPAGSGKSTLGKLITGLVPPGSVSRQRLEAICGERSDQVLHDLVGRALNFSDETPVTMMDRPEVIKNLIYGGEIQVRRLYQDARTVTVQAAHLATGNSLPKWRGGDRALLDRLLPVVVDGARWRFAEGSVLDYHEAILEAEAAAIVAECCAELEAVGLHRAFWQLPPSVEAARKGVLAASNTAVAFWQSCAAEDKGLSVAEAPSLRDVYLVYCAWYASEHTDGARARMAKDTFKASLQDIGVEVRMRSGSECVPKWRLRRDVVDAARGSVSPTGHAKLCAAAWGEDVGSGWTI